MKRLDSLTDQERLSSGSWNNRSTDCLKGLAMISTQRFTLTSFALGATLAVFLLGTATSSSATEASQANDTAHADRYEIADRKLLAAKNAEQPCTHAGQQAGVRSGLTREEVALETEMWRRSGLNRFVDQEIRQTLQGEHEAAQKRFEQLKQMARDGVLPMTYCDKAGLSSPAKACGGAL